MNRSLVPAALLAAGSLLAAPTRCQAPADASTGPPPRAVTTVRPPLLPHAVASFGACRGDRWLYVFGGHVGRRHEHTRDNVLGAFHRLDLEAGGDWETLPDGPPLQGTALVAAPDGTLYRVGGMTARNAPGEPEDLHSTASVCRFDPADGEWRELTPLPEPRSSHDAIVCGGRLYVIGGWRLNGGEDGDWLDTGWVADLGEQPLRWRALPPLGDRRRACAVATFAGRVVVLGGIDAQGPIATVRWFDPATAAWHDGPNLPGFAFGTAALGVGDRLYATVFDGLLLCWDGAGDWQPVAQLETPRYFHRLVEAAEPGALLALGGAGRGGHLSTVETVRTAAARGDALEIREWRVPAPGRVACRQALMLHDDTIWAFGGNRGLAGDRFAPAQLADDIWRVRLATMTAAHVGALPSGRQSMAAAVWGARRDNLVLGGLGIDSGAVKSVATGFRWDLRREQPMPFAATLPAGRTQFALVAHGDRLWVAGGVDFTPDGDGGSAGGDTRDVLVCDPSAEAPAFVPAGMRLPRPRRSFGAAVIGDELVLIGGLGDGFAHAGPCDIVDVATGEWREFAAPVDWVSPQVAAIGDRLYVACGGTMQGRRFHEDRALWSWHAERGWRRVVDELPFAVRHVQLRAWRNRLLFYGIEGGDIVVRTLEPDATVHSIDPMPHR